MRIELRCPYAEKDKAKALGARWDGAKKVWYLVDVEDLTPFMRWIPSHRQNPGVKQKRAKKATAVSGKSYAVTGPTIFQPMCDCNALPWEDCIHTEILAQNAML